MRDLVYLGSSPAEEPCAQFGADGYEPIAEEECNRYVRLLRSIVGPEPEGARLRVRWFDRDQGQYCEVVCEFDDRFPEAFDYAFRCESEAPPKWGTEP